MKNKKESPDYYPFEQAITDAVINSYEHLEKEEDFPIISAEIHLAVFPFVESGLLTEIKNIEIDRIEKTITITCGTTKDFNFGNPYKDPTDTVMLKISWKSITLEMVNNFKRKKEETIKNGIASSNCKIIGKHDY